MLTVYDCWTKTDGDRYFRVASTDTTNTEKGKPIRLFLTETLATSTKASSTGQGAYTQWMFVVTN